MKRTRKTKAILLTAWLLSGCLSLNTTTQTPALKEVTITLPVSNAGDEDLIDSKQLSFRIGAYYYPWYGPDRHWDSGYLGTPILGEYDSANEDIITQHIDWALHYNIDFYALSWWGKGSFEDEVITGPILDAIEGRDFRFAVLYESAGLLKLRDGKIDLDNDITRQQLISDFEYLAATLFQHPNILTIEGRPVIFLYLTRTFVGNVEAALSEAKSTAVAQGSAEPFIIGDEVYWQYPDQKRIGYFDGITAYNMHTSVPGIADRFADDVERQYRLWIKIAEKQGTTFIPNILPGFDEANHPVIPRSVELFNAQFTSAKEFASAENSIIMVTSWNEWHENTSIEPTEEEGTAYLEVLRNNQP